VLVDTESVRGITRLFDPHLTAISAGVHLGSIFVLAENASVLVSDSCHVVFSDHHLTKGNSISLTSAWNWLEVLVLAVLEGSTLSTVVSDNPLHVFFAEVSAETAWVDNLGISVVHLANNHSALSDHSALLGAWVTVLRVEL